MQPLKELAQLQRALASRASERLALVRRPLVFEWYAPDDPHSQARSELRAVWPGLYPLRLRVWRYGPAGGPWGWVLEEFGTARRGEICRRKRNAKAAAEAAMREAVAAEITWLEQQEVERQ